MLCSEVITCNKCKKSFTLYGFGYVSVPTLDEVACPFCSEKRILYFGNDQAIIQRLLSNYGLNEETNARITYLEKAVDDLGKKMDIMLKYAKDILTDSLVDALKNLIEIHEKNYHEFRNKR